MREVAIGLGVVAVLGTGGYFTWRYFQRKRDEDNARLAAARAPVQSGAGGSDGKSLGQMLAELGGRAVSEGAKYAFLGPKAYAGTQAAKGIQA